MKMRAAVAILVLATNVHHPVHADDIAPVGSGGFMVGSRVRLTAPGILERHRLQGVVVAMDESAMTLAADSGVPVVVPRAAITSLDVSAGRKRRTLKGAVLGAAGTGLFLAVAAPVDPNDCGAESPNFCSHGQALAIGAAGGAVWGALIGSFLKTDRWIHSPSGGWRVDVRPARYGGSVSISLLF